MGDTTPLLDLSTLAPDREFVRLTTKAEPDGSLRFFRTRDELGLVELQRLETAGRRSADIDPSNMSGDEAVYLQTVLDQLLQEMVFTEPLSEAVLAELTLNHKLAIVDAFTEVCLAGLTQADKAKVKPARRRTGAK